MWHRIWRTERKLRDFPVINHGSEELLNLTIVSYKCWTLGRVRLNPCGFAIYLARCYEKCIVIPNLHPSHNPCPLPCDLVVSASRVKYMSKHIYSSFIDTGLVHVTFPDQRNISRCDIRRGFLAYGIGLVPLCSWLSLKESIHFIATGLRNTERHAEQSRPKPAIWSQSLISIQSKSSEFQPAHIHGNEK